MRSQRIFVVGASGYIGRHLVAELVQRGHDVVCFARPHPVPSTSRLPRSTPPAFERAEVRFGQVTDLASVRRDGFRGERFDAVFSCLASRTGGIADAWRIEHQANLNVLEACKPAGVTQWVLLSAICVQKPRLAFQHAKLAFEEALIASGIAFSIVRPTAFFKSLAGQVERVQRGKPFLVFGDGERTSCKPISEADLSRFLADCLEDPTRRNAILPLGGPGPAITPKQQGAMLHALCGRPARYRHVPVSVMDAAIWILASLARVFPRLEDKAELGRIGRYYATESMLTLDPSRGPEGGYDADATPSYGTDTLHDFYARVLREGLEGQSLGDHAVFSRRRDETERST